ncbi:hypothetical protein [Maricaulis sp.]|uniref:hypothetical protein n=1 Tax=Maricaulis sp. TaxID=1486257 RepID=UPI003A9393C9
MKTRYYLDAFADDVNPCEETLAGWAQWLSQPDEGWNRDAARDGDTFTATSLTYSEHWFDTAAADRGYLTPPIAGEAAAAPDFLVPLHGPGLGWNADNMCADIASLVELMFESGESGCWIAAGKWQPPCTLTYRTDENGPRLERVAEEPAS